MLDLVAVSLYNRFRRPPSTPSLLFVTYLLYLSSLKSCKGTVSNKQLIVQSSCLYYMCSKSSESLSLSNSIEVASMNKVISLECYAVRFER
jgi:hypothetical protein